MVHYRPSGGRLGVTPPPTCPKCGSHRTEVVGRSDDGRTLTVRCNACGERSTREVDSNASGNDMTKQLEAIRAIATQPLARVSGPMLTVGELRLLYPSPELPKDDSIRQIVTPAAQSASAQAGAPQLGSVVSHFVQAFQRLADEWQSAFAPAAAEGAAA